MNNNLLILFLVFIVFILNICKENFNNLFDDSINDTLIRPIITYSCPPNTLLNENYLCIQQEVPDCPKNATIIQGECFFLNDTTSFICPKNYTLSDNDKCLHNYSSKIINSYCPDGYNSINNVCTKLAGLPTCLNGHIPFDGKCINNNFMIPRTFYNCPSNLKKKFGGICE